MRLLAAAAAAALIVPASALGWTWPVAGPVLIGFSFDPAHPYAAGQHRGIDIGAPAGASVGAPASGTVSFAGSVPGGGKIVTIQTADGYSVTLVHLGSFGVRRGAAVREGEPVGNVGPSGVPELDVPYVYLGIRRAGDEQGYLDPLLFLPASSPGAVEPPADGGEAVPPAPAPAPAAAPPAALLGLVLLLGCADALRRRLGRRRARSLPKAVRIIDSDALLPDDTDLLRERDASHRARVHDDCRGRAGSSPPAAGGRDLLPHRHRRARIQGLPRRGGTGARRQDVRRPHRRRLARAS